MNGELQPGETKRGKIMALAPETVDAMRKMRDEGKSVKYVSDFFHVSPGTVSKYCPAEPKNELHGEETIPKTLSDLDEKANEEAVKEYAKETVKGVKKAAAQDMQAGKLIQKYVAGLEARGLKLDLSKIESPEKFIRILKAACGDDCEMNGKEIVDEWTTNELKSKLTTPESKDQNKLTFSDVKDILLLRMLMKAVGDDRDDNQGIRGDQSNTSNLISEMRTENEKQRMFYEKKLEDMELKLRDLVIERRFQNVEDRQLSLSQSLQDQLAEISGKIETYRGVAMSGTSEEKQDAISHIEKLAEERARVNRAMEKLNQTQVLIQSPAAPAASNVYKNADGTTDYIRYAGDKFESSIKMISEAIQKRPPDLKKVVETPAPEQRMSVEQAEQLYQQLIQKPSVTPAEIDWINRYLPVRAQYYPPMPDNNPAATLVNTIPVEPEPVEPEPAEQELAEPEPAEPVPAAEVTEPIKPVIDRMHEQETAIAKELVDLGF